MSCTANGVADALRAAAVVMAEHRVELIELDRAIGDGDHGENMNRGFTAIVSSLDTMVPETPSAVLKLAATMLISKVGGAAGPLYGTAFLRASTAIESELDTAAVVAGLRAALEGVQARGKAVEGDKTMVDALIPAVAAAEQAAAEGADIAGVLTAASDAAGKGAESTVDLVARKGRASYLGERSAGHLDPGARSTALLLGALAEAAR
ncbi:dihydroxyacetone kinase subunit DhaL [Amycolatopsis pithecellobii]|uniref:Dihydroxyacetone kinase subunit L n=1 Tax=Amycolatopsis pithecellobii TaxID=664692 RepID=A0A6N7Z7W7_9PSEU|nr:dihydroxyacetone kinase subunit DhaL [Amycolatopsis pithecellobii]MTD57511.1 dihydroxyacetone kinase subunit L [Amycolatopsis pithecellobii]